MDFPRLSDARMFERLTPPGGPMAMVLDTDTYNEIDDQFALTYALLSYDRLDLQAVYAAPFHNERSDGPADGMRRSYEEIGRVLDRLGHSGEGFAFRGSEGYLPAAEEPRPSSAAQDLVERAMADRDGPLYVAAIGAITNVASALLMEPRIVERIVLVWVAGQPHSWRTASDFNLKQDMHASRLVFDCGVPLVHIPCKGAAELLKTTAAELDRYARARGPIGDYLCGIYDEAVGDRFAASRIIWDLAAIAWLIEPGWVPTDVVHAPMLTDRRTWSLSNARHFMREATSVNRDAVFGDLFRKLNRVEGGASRNS